MFIQANESELLSLEEVCARLLISPSTAYKLLKSGQLKGFKLGTWKIPLSSVYEYINQKCSQQ